MEELHFDVSTDWQRLGEFEKHVLVLAPCVTGVRRVNLHFELVHHELGICKKSQRCTEVGEDGKICEEREKTQEGELVKEDAGSGSRRARRGYCMSLSIAHHLPPLNKCKT